MEVINVVHARNEVEIFKNLSFDYHILNINGSIIFGADSFFVEVNRAFLSACSLESFSWPALEDTLWEFAMQCQSEKLAFCWRDADNLALTDMKAFLLAVDVLTSTARLLYNGENRKEFLIFLVGSHVSFGS